MAPEDIEVFLPAFREDDFQNVWSLIDKSFQAQYQSFSDWKEHVSQRYRNNKLAHEVFITAEGLTHHFELVPSPHNYNAILGYAILLGRRLLPAVQLSEEDTGGGCARPARRPPPGRPWGFEAVKAEVDFLRAV